MPIPNFNSNSDLNIPQDLLRPSEVTVLTPKTKTFRTQYQTNAGKSTSRSYSKDSIESIDNESELLQIHSGLSSVALQGQVSGDGVDQTQTPNQNQTADRTNAQNISDKTNSDKQINSQRSSSSKLNILQATSICGNDITASVFYVITQLSKDAGIYAPICTILASIVLYCFRAIYTEVVLSLPLNGGVYNLLLNSCQRKVVACVAACLTILSYVATGVVSSVTAVQYLQGMDLDQYYYVNYSETDSGSDHYSDSNSDSYYSFMNNINKIYGAVMILLFFALLMLMGIKESGNCAAILFITHLSVLGTLMGFCIWHIGEKLLLFYGYQDQDLQQQSEGTSSKIGESIDTGLSLATTISDKIVSSTPQSDSSDSNNTNDTSKQFQQLTFSQNLSLPQTQQSSLTLSLFYGFSSAMLGCSGFETSANFIENQSTPLLHTYPQVLKYMWLSSSIINIGFAMFSVILIPIDELRNGKIKDPLAYMGEKVMSMNNNSLNNNTIILNGKFFANIIRLDACFVLAGSVLTSYVGVTGLLSRMASDRCLPELFASRVSVRDWIKWMIQQIGESVCNRAGNYDNIPQIPDDLDSPSNIDKGNIVNQYTYTNTSSNGNPPTFCILFFFLICTILTISCDAELDLLASIYSLSFLLVMACFALSGLWLRYTRPSLPRPYQIHNQLSVFLIGFVSVFTAFLGAVLKAGYKTEQQELEQQPTLAYFICYYSATLGLVMLTFYRVQLLIGLSYVAKVFDWFGPMFRMQEGFRKRSLEDDKDILSSIVLQQTQSESSGELRTSQTNSNDMVQQQSYQTTNRISHYFLSKYREIRNQSVLYLTKDCDLAKLNKACRYILDNEDVGRIRIVHCYYSESVETQVTTKSTDKVSSNDTVNNGHSSSIAQKLKVAVAILQTLYHRDKVRIDLVLVQTPQLLVNEEQQSNLKFSPAMIRYLSHSLKVPRSLIFINCPGVHFQFRIEKLGGVRVILDDSKTSNTNGTSGTNGTDGKYGISTSSDYGPTKFIDSVTDMEYQRLLAPETAATAGVNNLEIPNVSSVE